MEAEVTAELLRKAVNEEDEARAKLQLAGVFGWDDLDFETRPRRTMYIDFLYNSLRSAAKIGLPWRSMPAVYSLGRVLLDNCVQLDFAASLRTFRQSYIALFGREREVPESMLLKLTDVFYDSFFKHYHLFRYCFTQARERSETAYSLAVQVPSSESSAPLTTAKDFRIWDYEERVKQIEEHAKQKRLQSQDYLSRQLAELDNQTRAAAAVGDAEYDGRNAIRKIARAQMEKSMLALRSTIDCSSTELIEMLEKTALPRPAPLGPPPRFKPKSAVTASKLSRADTKSTK